MRDETFEAVRYAALQRYPELHEISEADLRDYAELALHSLQILCARLFELNTYTETVKVESGCCFLHAVPIVEIQSAVDAEGNLVEWFGVVKDLGIVEVSPVLDGKYVTFTYRGGFETLPRLVITAAADLLALLYRDRGVTVQLPDIRVMENELPQSVQLAIKTFRLAL